MRYSEFSEALKPSEYRNLVKGWDKTRYAELFGGRNRIYLPLEAPETQKGAEWQSGIGALNIATLPGAYGKAVRALNPSGTLATIPGSPAVAAHVLRHTEATTDALHLCELHPTEISHGEKHP